jgi:hypothetical protein
MAVAYPLGLRTIIQANKARTQSAAFRVLQPRRGLGYNQPVGTEPSVIWDCTFRFTRAEAGVFRMWFKHDLDEGREEVLIPIRTEFGLVDYTARFLPDSLLLTSQVGEVWEYSARLLARAMVIPGTAPSSEGLTTSYPLALRTILKQSKRRQQQAPFAVSDTEAAYAHFDAAGTDHPPVWDIQLRFTPDEAALFMVWFRDVLDMGVKSFTVPIGTEFGIIEHRVQFLPGGLLNASEDGETFTYRAAIAARVLLIPPPWKNVDELIAYMAGQRRPMSTTPQDWSRFQAHGNGVRWVRPAGAHANTQDGLTYDTAWLGFGAIDTGDLGPDTTLKIRGTFVNDTFEIPVSGDASDYFDIDIAHEVGEDQLLITQAEPVDSGDWIGPDGNGEYYKEGIDTSQNMLLVDGNRIRGPSVTAKARRRITAVDLGTSACSVGGTERPIVTGQKVYLPGDFDQGRVPEYDDGLGGAPLPINTPLYMIAMSSSSFKFALTYADALAGTAITLLDRGGLDDIPATNWFIYYLNPATHWDTLPGALDFNTYGWEPETERLYWKPPEGTVPGDHEVLLSSDKLTTTGACIYANNKSYVRIFGGGEYGGIFDDTPAPRGELAYAHLNPVYIVGGTHIYIDGVYIHGCRSGVIFNGTTHGVVRNCWIRDFGHHAAGGETVSTAEPYLLLERSLLEDGGLLNDNGDNQGFVTNPVCTGTRIRRTLVRRVGRNDSFANPATFVVDSSDDVAVYFNIAEDCVGMGIQFGAGADGDVTNAAAVGNLFLSHGRRQPRAGASNSVNNVFALRTQTAAYSIIGVDLLGNVMLDCMPTEQTGSGADSAALVRERVAVAGSQISSVRFDRNAVVGLGAGRVFAQRTTSGAFTPPTLTADNNLYSGLKGDGFFSRALGVAAVVEYDSDEVFGRTPGTWQADSGQDAHSVAMPYYGELRHRTATPEMLELLRLYDEYDTDDRPTEAVLGNFPLMEELV